MAKKKIRVLLIEDQLGVANIIRSALMEAETVEFAVEYADRLSLALEHIAKGAMDVILLDLGLPDSTGFATFEKIYAAAPLVPIVVLTGMGDEEMGAKAVSHGAQDFLVKGHMDITSLPRTLIFAIQRSKK